MRPYIICHMVASIDGRIDCHMVDKISGEEYYTTLDELQCPSSLEGRVTMAHYTALPEPFTAADSTPIGHAETHKATDAQGYHIAVDTRGMLRWPSDFSEEKPLLVITSCLASKAYLDTLRCQNISYIAVGEQAIDLPKAMEILAADFGVERMTVLGGGHINGGFLAAGLIDEVSLLLAPGIDGRRGMTALFDGIDQPDRLPTHLSLLSLDRLPGDILWLRYKVER